MRIALLFSFFFILFTFGKTFAQSDIANEFEKFGPPNSVAYYTLKDAFKFPEGAYKLQLAGSIEDVKHFKKIGQLKNLQSLSLKNNNLDSLPQSFSAFKSLLYFESLNNKLNQIPSETALAWTQLTVLKIGKASLDSLPETAGAWGNLASIELQSIASKDTFKFPKQVKYWQNLTQIMFYNLRLYRLSSAFGKLPKLKSVYMINCELSTLPASLANLQSMEELVLDSNKLEIYPNCLNEMKNLRYLSLKNNQLNKISESISNLQRLKTLDLTGNPIDAYDIEILKVLLPNCKIIH